MKNNLLIGGLLVLLGAGGAYGYLTSKRAPQDEMPSTVIPVAGMCAKHQVAENDWCAGHDIPESQCELCKAGELPPGEKK
jgi:hypothetical protein